MEPGVQPHSGLHSHVRSLWTTLPAAYDRLYSDANKARLEHAVVKLSVAGFVTHLALVFLARTLSHPPAFAAAAGRNYLSAIYTPFSFILFYEVLVLIAAILQSTTRSIANQFEIASLIFVRGFFKDIAEIDDVGDLTHFSPQILPVFFDMCAGLLMFLLVTVFQHASRGAPVAKAAQGVAAATKTFIARKKVIALALTVLLLSLAAYNLGIYAQDAYHVIYQGAKARLDLRTLYYTDVFSVMIFTDVLILILSLMVSDRYELVFRNAAFVISTILIRFSLTIARPYGAPLALLGMVFGILTLLVYNYNTRVRAAGQTG